MFGKALLTIPLTVLLTSGTALACEPCASNLSLGQSLRKADLVIVGKRTDYDPSAPARETAKVAVVRVLKGRLRKGEVTVRSWYGMCPYGIIVDDKTYLMILKASSEVPGAYEAVDSGCSVKTLPVESGAVSMDGKRLTLERLKRRYGLRSASRSRRRA